MADIQIGDTRPQVHAVSMLDRLRRAALCAYEDIPDCPQNDDHIAYWLDKSELNAVDIAIDIDRIVFSILRALREPTEAMIQAGTAADWVGEEEDRAGLSIMPNQEITFDENGDPFSRLRPGIWAAMIDKAMQDRP